MVADADRAAPAPEPRRGRAAVARRRARGWRAASGRGGAAAGWRRAWAASAGAAACRRAPAGADRDRRGAWACASARRRAMVEAEIARARGGAGGRRDLTHPFGAPPTSAPSLVSAQRSRRPETSRGGGPAAVCSAQTVTENGTVAAGTGARGRAAAAPAAPAPLTALQRRQRPCGHDVRAARRGGAPGARGLARDGRRFARLGRR